MSIKTSNNSCSHVNIIHWSTFIKTMREDPSFISLTLAWTFPLCILMSYTLTKKNNIKSGKNCALRHHANNFTTTERDPEWAARLTLFIHWIFFLFKFFYLHNFPYCCLQSAFSYWCKLFCIHSFLKEHKRSRTQKIIFESTLLD